MLFPVNPVRTDRNLFPSTGGGRASGVMF